MQKRSIVGKEVCVYGIRNVEWGRRVGREIVGTFITPKVPD